MLSFYKKYYKTVFDISLIIITVLLVMWLFSFMYNIATPIFIAFAIFLAIEPLARFLNKRGMKKSIATGISMLLFLSIILGIIVGGSIVFISQMNNVIHKIPQYQTLIEHEFVKQVEYLQTQYDTLHLPVEVTDKIAEYAALAATYIGNFTMWLFNFLISIVSSFSTFMLHFAVGTILAYFLSLEIEQWKRLARKKTPTTFKTAFYFLKEHVITGIAGYIKAQGKLVSITFIIIFASLLLLGVNNAFSISVLAAVFDLLPLLGVSTIFIPWVLYLFIVGQTTLALWLTGLWLVVILFRQFFEPKIMGDSLGVSAFTMLSFMIISLSLFGVAGLILSPILIILIKALYEQGYLKSWIRAPEDYDKSQELDSSDPDQAQSQG